MNTEDFITKARKVHGDRFDYSQTNYVNNKTPVTIVDPVYGPFEIIPANHLRGFSNTTKIKNSPEYRKQNFVKKARIVHGNRFDYSQVIFKTGVKSTHQVLIKDTITGKEFFQTPQYHLKKFDPDRIRVDEIDHIIPISVLCRRDIKNKQFRQSPLFKFLDSSINKQTLPKSENAAKLDRITISGVEYLGRNIRNNHSLLRLVIKEKIHVSDSFIDDLFQKQYEHMRPKGKLVGYVGPMFASKTSSLIKLAKIASKPVMIKVAFDNRYSENKVVNHDGEYFESLSIDKWDEQLIEKYNTFLFDEIQFFKSPYFVGDVVQIIKTLLEKEKNVYFSGLDLDAFGNIFIQPELLALADELHKKKAICSVCGDPASKTMKLSGGEQQVELGSHDKYEPRCNKHWNLPWVT